MPGLWDQFFGTESKMKPFNKQSLKGLEGLLQGGGLQNNTLYGSGNDYLQSLLSNDPQAFKNFEAPYMQNFEQNIVPGIVERFAGAGTGAGALSSSGLNNSLAQAGRSLQTDLAGLRSGLQMQALPQALNYAQAPVQNQLQASSLIPNQMYEKQGIEGLFQQLLIALVKNGGKIASGGFGKGGF